MPTIAEFLDALAPEAVGKYDGTENPDNPRTAKIPVTFFGLPDGKRHLVEAPVTPEIAKLAGQVVAHGFRFEAEVLTTGLVSIDCCNEDDQIAIHLCNNNEEVHGALEKVVRDAADYLELHG